MGRSICLQLCWFLVESQPCRACSVWVYPTPTRVRWEVLQASSGHAQEAFPWFSFTSDQPPPSSASHKTPTSISQLWELPVIHKSPEQSPYGRIFEFLFLISALCPWFFPTVQWNGSADVFPCLGIKLLNVSWNNLIFLAFQRTWNYIHYSGCLLLYSLKNIKIELNKEWFKWIWGSEGGLRLCVHTGLSVPRCDFALSDVNKWGDLPLAE